METFDRLDCGAPGAVDVAVTLPWERRTRSRQRVTLDDGNEALLALPRGTVLRHGDVLRGACGGQLRVMAAAETVSTAHAEDGTSLLRAAYHLGNRHVPIELKPDHLKIEPDHVLADMLRAMHLIVNEANAAFEPEGGAYAAGHAAHAGGHDHGHDHGHGSHDHHH